MRIKIFQKPNVIHVDIQVMSPNNVRHQQKLRQDTINLDHVIPVMTGDLPEEGLIHPSIAKGTVQKVIVDSIEKELHHRDSVQDTQGQKNEPFEVIRPFIMNVEEITRVGSTVGHQHDEVNGMDPDKGQMIQGEHTIQTENGAALETDIMTTKAIINNPEVHLEIA